MQTLEEYILKKYNNEVNWFETEVKESYHLQRISNVLSNKYYLNGKHKILQRENSAWKGKEFITTKLVLQEAKQILSFHDTYLLGRKVSLSGNDNLVKEFNKVYKKGNYSKIDFNILRKVNRYGDCFEYIYLDNNQEIKSKIINSEDSYPIYSEDTNEYIGFIEHYTSNSNKVSYYNIYSPDMVETYNNEDGELHKTGEYKNISGLPIHYHNYSDVDDNFGRSELEDIKPILDLIEDILSKMSDAVYTLSLNPMAVVTGQAVKESIPADAVGFNINLDMGDMKFINATMDYSTIKLLLDNLHKKLETIAGIPSVAMGNSNVANVSEVSLSMLYSLASVKAMINEQWLREGFENRWEIIKKLLALKGVVVDIEGEIDCVFNYSKPINNEEQLQNIKTQYDMGAISLQTIIEQSYLTNNSIAELDRIKKEQKEKQKVESNNIESRNLISEKEYGNNKGEIVKPTNP